MALEVLFYFFCAHSKILQNVAKYRSILILSRIAKGFLAESPSPPPPHTREKKDFILQTNEQFGINDFIPRPLHKNL